GIGGALIAPEADVHLDDADRAGLDEIEIVRIGAVVGRDGDGGREDVLGVDAFLDHGVHVVAVVLPARRVIFALLFRRRSIIDPLPAIENGLTGIGVLLAGRLGLRLGATAFFRQAEVANLLGEHLVEAALAVRGTLTGALVIRPGLRVERMAVAELNVVAGGRRELALRAGKLAI